MAMARQDISNSITERPPVHSQPGVFPKSIEDISFPHPPKAGEPHLSQAYGIDLAKAGEKELRC